MASAGQRSRLVTIERLTEAKGGSGYPTSSWTVLARVWMSRKDVAQGSLAATERTAVAQVASRTYTEWSMPYQATMDPETVDVPKTRRLVYGGRTMDIILAQPTEGRGMRRFITLQTVASSKVPA